MENLQNKIGKGIEIFAKGFAAQLTDTNAIFVSTVVGLSNCTGKKPVHDAISSAAGTMAVFAVANGVVNVVGNFDYINKK